MNTLSNYITEYIEYCEYRKRLDSKTLKAYRIDLKQYEDFCTELSDFFGKRVVDHFITSLHKKYKPKTVKRKIASQTYSSALIILIIPLHYSAEAK